MPSGATVAFDVTLDVVLVQVVVVAKLSLLRIWLLGANVSSPVLSINVALVPREKVMRGSRVLLLKKYNDIAGIGPAPVIKPDAPLNSPKRVLYKPVPNESPNAPLYSPVDMI